MPVAHHLASRPPRPGRALFFRGERALVGARVALLPLPPWLPWSRSRASTASRAPAPSSGYPPDTFAISADEHAATTALLPALHRVLPLYPGIRIEIVTQNGLDIVAERYDAGVRIGDVVAGDMIAVPIGPDIRMLPVSSPAYWKRHPKPKTPHELTRHNCINLRLLTCPSSDAPSPRIEPSSRGVHLRVGQRSRPLLA
ncbi:MAG: transcriptional regulator, LysR family [Labilithrix sp.]|nr:transcriptional regulator, LysR family [Labilithrix sp.]